jgi:hypothetical protein
MRPEKELFFHPDCTVDPGISPDHALLLVGCHHRSGIEEILLSPCPEDLFE